MPLQPYLDLTILKRDARKEEKQNPPWPSFAKGGN
jgi:hypothetical protein